MHVIDIKHGATSHRIQGLRGSVSVPGDKSISHRSLILGSQARGTTRISGLLEAEDILSTMHALQALGVNIFFEDSQWYVEGVGIGGLKAPSKVIDMGNTGTGVRLMMGLVASYPFVTEFMGDKSLCSRPMGRILDPLKMMGVEVVSCQEGMRLPIAMRGGTQLKSLHYTLPVASAQVKSAILLASLNIEGETSIVEPHPTRDHTERMLKGLGATIDTYDENNGAKRIIFKGKPSLKAMDIHVPGDPSSAAFLAVAAIIVPNSEIRLKHVCINPHRIGLYTTLQEMGATILFENIRQEAGDKVADIVVKTSALKGITVPGSRAASMIDEYPILSIAASCANGTTIMEGLAELRVKESNRLDATQQGLVLSGVNAQVEGDTLIVHGGEIKGGATIPTYMDHRLAMSFLILGCVSKQPITIDDKTMIATSFPRFIEIINQLGASIL